MPSWPYSKPVVINMMPACLQGVYIRQVTLKLVTDDRPSPCLIYALFWNLNYTFHVTHISNSRLMIKSHFFYTQWPVYWVKSNSLSLWLIDAGWVHFYIIVYYELLATHSYCTFCFVALAPNWRWYRWILPRSCLWFQLWIRTHLSPKHLPSTIYSKTYWFIFHS